jgi:hypothetical protein
MLVCTLKARHGPHGRRATLGVATTLGQKPAELDGRERAVQIEVCRRLGVPRRGNRGISLAGARVSRVSKTSSVVWLATSVGEGLVGCVVEAGVERL